MILLQENSIVKSVSDQKTTTCVCGYMLKTDIGSATEK